MGNSSFNLQLEKFYLIHNIESMAEIARKPLYRVTCGDIGTKLEDTEKVRLSTTMKMTVILN